MKKWLRVESGGLRVKKTAFAGRVRGRWSRNPQPTTLDPAVRGGFTLLEVLVSIFILLFGLLAVAAVVPIAGLRIIQTKQADQSAACGQSAMRDVKVRRMTEPRKWQYYGGSGFTDVPVSGADGPLISFSTSFAIDPLGFAKNYGDTTALGAMARFPYYAPAAYTTMLRVTLKDAGGGQLPYALADRIFTWHDDLEIPVPTDPGARPVAMQDSGGNVWEIEGKYSWLATVTPEVTVPDVTSPDRHYIDRHRSYRVSIIVFYNRDFSPPNNPLDPQIPSERAVKSQIVDGTGALYGGGDLQLFCDSSATPPQSGEYLDVKKGQWLMLSATDTLTTRNVFRWYRVIAAGETANESDDGVDLNGDGDSVDWFREVTVAGPDWSPAWHTGTSGQVDAALFTRVIGVYTTTIEMDEPGSLWGN